MIRIETGRDNLNHLDFSPDGRFLLATPPDSKLRIPIFDLSRSVETPTFVFHPKIHWRRVNSLLIACFTNQNDLVASVSTSSDRRYISVFSWPAGKIKHLHEVHGRGPINYFELSDERKCVTQIQDFATGYWSPDVSIDYWKIGTSGLANLARLGSQKSWFLVSKNLNWYVTVSNSGDVSVQNTRSIFSSFYFTESSIVQLLFSPSSNYLVSLFASEPQSGTSPYFFQVYSLQERKSLGSRYQLKLISRQPITLVAITPDDRNLLVVQDNLIYVFDLLTGVEKTCFDFGLESILALKVTDDGTMFAVTDSRGTIIVTDIDF